jgi:hypothetical protein
MHAFRRIVEGREFDKVADLLAENVVLHSPIAFKPYHGRESVATIINTVAAVLEDFTFQREIGAETDENRALVFDARVGDLSIQGCDFLHTDAGGLIDQLTVMLRPLKAIQAFEERMRVQFAGAMAAGSDS